MLLPRTDEDEVEPLFNFYRVGWHMARQGMFLPCIHNNQATIIELMYAEYDLQAGYSAYIHHSRKSQRDKL
jgi:hypothetical protein